MHIDTKMYLVRLYETEKGVTKQRQYHDDQGREYAALSYFSEAVPSNKVLWAYGVNPMLLSLL